MWILIKTASKWAPGVSGAFEMLFETRCADDSSDPTDSDDDYVSPASESESDCNILKIDLSSTSSETNRKGVPILIGMSGV